jgi:hypothetical protein
MIKRIFGRDAGAAAVVHDRTTLQTSARAPISVRIGQLILILQADSGKP